MQDTLCLAEGPGRKTHYVLRGGAGVQDTLCLAGAGAQDALCLAGWPGCNTHYPKEEVEMKRKGKRRKEEDE